MIKYNHNDSSWYLGCNSDKDDGFLPSSLANIINYHCIIIMIINDIDYSRWYWWSTIIIVYYFSANFLMLMIGGVTHRMRLQVKSKSFVSFTSCQHHFRKPALSSSLMVKTWSIFNKFPKLNLPSDF